ncbi:hypothetical protein I203_103493 [Kwoniella mangroviensis CBS 8507]|uniref:uncharacterized protein n=1 Tax=Kwoniella mangroviensis CBS 8507 TaxID=1296122 RepID=UPI00080D1BAC|nr:uncharacterized protein I203_04408 [Kwoniella mangroviensis CBS 8507]OCF66830.1 hypothetical protein I203_04408 [Kwoniella mangroviensis CBS 8507]
MTFGMNNQLHHSPAPDSNPTMTRDEIPSRSGKTDRQRPQGIIDVTSSASTPTPNALSPTTSSTQISIMNNSHIYSPSKPKPKRRSWFSLRRTKQLIDQSNQTTSIPEENHLITPLPPPSAWNGQPEERLRPIQFQPNRIQTLYVTKSERDLYLAAMSQLDQAPPPLPLWSDRAPELPKLNTQLTPLKAPSIPNGSIGRSGGHARSISEGGSTAFHPLTSRPLSPKLVTSPQMGRSGLMVRDEFRRTAPPQQSKHALMAFIPPSGLRLTGFPPSAISAVDLVLQENWDQGIAVRSESAESLGERKEDDEFTWKVEMEGKVWKRKGSQELDSIRLLIALMSILGIHGWTLVENVQAGGSKKDAHNLLFSYSPETSINPPLFFALSLPLPDRLSLICPPRKVTPAIISALREAIISSPAKMYKHAREGTAATGVTVTSDTNGSLNEGRSKSPKISWKGYDPRGIKLEGWVHDGVYRFWIDGMRRWLGGTVKRKVVESLHPNLVIAIINNITNLHFELAASILLLPIAKGRDVFIFSSLPSSGLSVVDSYVPKAPSIAGTESPVLVSPMASVPVQDLPDDPREIDPDNRQLPWTSVVNNQARPPSPVKSSRPPPSSTGNMSNDNSRKRTASRESSKPLLAAPSASANSTPKHKNVLLKQNSLQRRRSSSANGNHSQPPSAIGHGNGNDRHSVDGRHSTQDTYQPSQDDSRQFKVMNPDDASERWSFIDPPPNVGKLGVTMFDTTGGHVHQYLPPQTAGRTSGEDDSRDKHNSSIYADAPTKPVRLIPIQNDQPTRHVNRGILESTSPESELGFGENDTQSDLNHANPITKPLALGQPIDRDYREDDHGGNDGMMIGKMPLKDSDSPERRGRQNIVDLGSAIQSVHGSVGYLQSMISGISGHHGKRLSVDLDNVQQQQQQATQGSKASNAVPKPEIVIINPSSHNHSSGKSCQDHTPPPLPSRPHPDHIPESTLPISTSPTRTQPTEEEVARQRNKYLEWERKGKVKNGMRRIWDEDENSWRDIPISHGEGVGSGRTKVTLG